ncbi:hypothetical protein BJ875DRAFT_483076 [Amylocarpus encephaloides]|uniref:Uncharacterized protein n=1 Tax=Amylocarpus encephaloides TaxID=45428 RepID=A0A9P8C801_9HELO|nr:hypothetical protein BJ875DRAFT_483076 [Amylocarpus encephaloides]
MRVLNLAVTFVGVLAVGNALPINTVIEYTHSVPLSRRHEITKKSFHSFEGSGVTDGHVVKRSDVDIEARQTCNQRWTEKCDLDTKKREEIIEVREPCNQQWSARCGGNAKKREEIVEKRKACRGKWTAKCYRDTKKRDEVVETLPNPDSGFTNCNNKFHPGCFVAKMKKRWVSLWDRHSGKGSQACSTKWEAHCRKTKRDLNEKKSPVVERQNCNWFFSWKCVGGQKKRSTETKAERREVVEVKNRKRCNGIFLPRCRISAPTPTEPVNPEDPVKPEEPEVGKRELEVEARQNCNGRFNDKCGLDNKRATKQVKPRGCTLWWRPQCGGSE